MINQSDVATVLKPHKCGMIFAIDPGPENSAFLCWNGQAIYYSGILHNVGLLGLVQLHAQPGTTGSIETLAIEQVASFGMPVGREVFETVYWSGRFAQAWVERRPESSVVRITRNEIKNHLCHSSRGNDATIRQALIDRLGAPGTKKKPGLTYGVTKDIWAALAVAVTVGDTLK